VEMYTNIRASHNPEIFWKMTWELFNVIKETDIVKRQYFEQ